MDIFRGTAKVVIISFASLSSSSLISYSSFIQSLTSMFTLDITQPGLVDCSACVHTVTLRGPSLGGFARSSASNQVGSKFVFQSQYSS